MIRLIATDLDGTLLEKGGALPEGFYDVAEGLKKLGILLVAASGRQYDNLRRKSFYNTEGRKSPIWALAGKRFGRKDIFNGENCDENAAGGDGRR